MRKFVPIVLLWAALVATAAPQRDPATRQTVVGTVTLGESTAVVRQRTFDIVWRTVKEKHFDPTLGGVDWDKIRERYEPMASTVKSDAELYAILQRMLQELHQSHFNIIPPEAVVEDDSREPATGGVGISLSMVDRMALITRVEPESAAARAGIRAGYVITSVDQTAVDEIAARYAKSTEPPPIVRLRLGRSVLARVGGKPGTSVRIVFLDGRDRRREITLERERLKGEMSPRFGNFPPQYTEFESKRLAGGIGYIRFNIFVTPLMDKIRGAIRSMSDAPGIIFDIRGNPGGLGGMSSGIAGLLETKQTSLGRMTLRSGYQNFAVFPQKDPYTGPVVILIDGGSASTSEVFSAGMQEIGRAIIVGERSVGAALPSVIEKLPTGALFQYAIADFKTPKGTLIEGRGVIPDVEVKISRKLLLRGRDAQLDAAIQQIHKLTRSAPTGSNHVGVKRVAA